MERLNTYLSTRAIRALVVPSSYLGFSIFGNETKLSTSEAEIPKVSQIKVSLTFDQFDKASKAEFLNSLNKEFIRETVKLVHPIVGSLNGSWPYIRSGYSGKERFAFEKPFVFGKYEIKGHALFLRGENKNDDSYYRLGASASGTHGSIHSAFINGGIGCCLAASTAGLYSAILRPLDWRNPSVSATNLQLLFRLAVRLASISSLFCIGGFALDFSSQFIEQVRREIDVFNQIGSATSLAILMSLATKPRTFEKSLRCVAIFSSIIFILYHMDEKVAKHRGTTNALMSIEIPKFLNYLTR